MKLLSVFLLLGVCEGEGGARGSSTFVVAAYEDLYLSGGAGVQAAPLLSLRSGNPNGRSAAAVRQPLLPGVVVDRVTFAYRYDTGYGPTGVGSNFTLRVAGQQVYASPHLTDYEYSQNRSNYSSPVQVDASALGIAVPAAAAAAGKPARLELAFDNNDRNVQLLLPLEVTVLCSGAPGVLTNGSCTPPPPPAPTQVFMKGDNITGHNPANDTRSYN